jgi:ribose 1,5-bisphosphokinase PhnN
VRVVCVTAPPQILESRLKGRGRDGDIAGRLARSEEISPLSPPDLFIENVGAPETNAKILAKFLVGTLS